MLTGWNGLCFVLREQRRIDAIKKCVYQFKIFVNKEEAAVSEAFHLAEDFTADQFQQAFHLWIKGKPRHIAIQLFYKPNAKRWLLLADTEMPIPST